MQLKRPKVIRGTLAAATCTLLGNGSTNAVAASLQDWEFDSAVLFYNEANRVSVLEPVINLRAPLGDESFFTLHLVLDTLSGSSPNGAIPNAVEQTFSGPSGSNAYSVAAGQTPLDPTFKDERGAGSISLEKPLATNLKGVFGANASQEFDYTSVGVSASFSLDINNKLTTLTAGGAVNFDTVSPVGGAPEPKSPVTAPVPVPTDASISTVNTLASASGSAVVNGENEGEGGGTGPGKSKTVSDFLFGITQVLGRKTLLQVNYGYGKSSGYLTDPYKVLSVVDSTNAVSPDPNCGVLAIDTNGDCAYLHESRPDSRVRQSVYWKINHQFTDDVVYFSYRHYWDDWGVTAQTADLRYRLELGHKHYLQPHFRYSKQTAADFYHYFLINGDYSNTYASADYRLGDMTTVTTGLLYGIELSKDSEFSIRVERMVQTGESHPDVAKFSPTLSSFDLFPEVKASIVQLSYRYSF